MHEINRCGRLRLQVSARVADVNAVLSNADTVLTENCLFVCFYFVSVWIVSVLGPKTSGQQYLTQLLGAIETYLHPANMGKWVNAISEIIVQIPKYLFDRLIVERYKPHTWKRPVPGE